MTPQQFETLVNRLEVDARRSPGSYKLKVLLLAILGNLYVAAVLLLIVALMVLLAVSAVALKALAVKLLIVVGILLWRILKALWVKIDPPAGTEVDAGQAPELFAMLEDLRRSLRAPRFHQVLITDDFNAGVVQSPRLGLFGWHRNYLLIGLPLMKALTYEQFKAVLAHELGHLAKGHGSTSNWLYRQRLRWGRLVEALDAAESRGGMLFKPFMKWFAPYFHAYSFPLARANEYEADATSARLTSPQAAAEALTSVNVVGDYLAERYWPRLHRQADETPAPAFAPYHAMAQGVAADLEGASVQEWLDRAMARGTDVVDTHPALRERLGAIGQQPRLSVPALGGGADRLLGGALRSITEAFDARWKENIRESWERRHREVQEGRSRLAELDARCEAAAELTLQEIYDRARLTEEFGGQPEGALAQFRALHERAPDSAVACFALGARLLARDDAEGVGLVEQAMGHDEDCIVRGSEHLRDYHWRGGRTGEAHAWHERMIARARLEEAAAKEREVVLLKDKFEAHGLSEEALATLRTELGAVPHLRRAYLAKKRVEHLPHRPCWVFGFTVTSLFRLHRKRRVEEALRHLQGHVGFPAETVVINCDGDNHRFGRKLRWTRGARVV
jgi:Zn-dependent protease with chaperone function